MNIGNITSNNMNLTENGRFMQIELYEKEIERLNNIINELENYLNEQVNYMTHNSIERMVAFDCCRRKLQELKGSNRTIPPEVIGTNGEDGGLFDYGDR